MQTDEHGQGAGQGAGQQDEQDDWLAGATVSASSQQLEVGQVQIALSDLDLPHPDEWGDSGTALA